MGKLSLVGVAVGIAITLGASEQALAGVVYSTGFEPPTYTTGALAGQDGWFAGSGTDIGMVETTTVLAGMQAVEFDATGVSGQHFDGHAVPSSGTYMQVTDEFFESSTPHPNVAWDAIALFGDASVLGQLIVGISGDAFLMFPPRHGSGLRAGYGLSLAHFHDGY
ncbi:MAG TPA: hypothetical protein VLX09_04890 [Stellaceae bacterium]|nr:hypothetical protein [Stellaceae bacterium]